MNLATPLQERDLPPPQGTEGSSLDQIIDPLLNLVLQSSPLLQVGALVFDIANGTTRDLVSKRVQEFMALNQIDPTTSADQVLISMAKDGSLEKLAQEIATLNSDNLEQ